MQKEGGGGAWPRYAARWCSAAGRARGRAPGRPRGQTPGCALVALSGFMSGFVCECHLPREGLIEIITYVAAAWKSKLALGL